jgi:flagellar biosynthesis/type III secretory pathway M-ring protein FliF/YscJ
VIRIVLLVIVLVMAPTAAFFLWAWAVKIKEERKLAGTLPEWQDLPLTWLAIAGLVCLIVGVLVMFFTQSQGYGGLFAS